mgnify:CR=1 FL=1
MSDFDWLDDLRDIDAEVESRFLPVGRYRVKIESVTAETKVFQAIPHRMLKVICRDQDTGKQYRRTYQMTDKTGAMARQRLTIMGEQWLKSGLKTFAKMATDEKEVATCPVVWLVCEERQGQPKPVAPGEEPGPPQVYKDERFEKCDNQVPNDSLPPF